MYYAAFVSLPLLSVILPLFFMYVNILLVLKGFEYGNIRDGEEKSLVAGSNCLHEVWLGLEKHFLK